MTGRPRSDRAHVWQQGRRTGAQAVHGPRHGRGRWLAVAGYAGLALVCLAMGALTFVLVAPPLDRVRDRLVDEVKARTGRTLIVAGPISVTLFPRAIVSLGDVAMLPPEGVEGAPTITVPTLDVETSLRSLVSRRPRLDRLTLHRPTIELVIDAQGRRSWDFAVPSPRAEPPRAAPPGGSEGGSEKASPGLSEGMATIEGITYITSGQPRPWAVRVVGGTVRYHDERTGVRQEIGGLNLDLAGDKRSGPVNAQGTLTWHGEPWRFSAAAAHEVLAGRPGTVTFNLAGAPVEAAFQGTLAVKNAVAADGSLSLGPFTYRGLKVGPSVLAVSMAAGTAKATLQQVELLRRHGAGHHDAGHHRPCAGNRHQPQADRRIPPGPARRHGGHRLARRPRHRRARSHGARQLRAADRRDAAGQSAGGRCGRRHHRHRHRQEPARPAARPAGPSRAPA